MKQSVRSKTATSLDTTEKAGDMNDSGMQVPGLNACVFDDPV